MTVAAILHGACGLSTLHWNVDNAVKRILSYLYSKGGAPIAVYGIQLH